MFFIYCLFVCLNPLPTKIKKNTDYLFSTLLLFFILPDRCYWPIKIYPKQNMGYITLMDSLTFIWRSWKMLRSTISLTGWNISPSLSMGSGINRSLWHLNFICFLCFCPFWYVLKWRDKALSKLKKKPTKGVFFENYITIYSNFAFCNLLSNYNFNYKKKGKCLLYANIT